MDRKPATWMTALAAGAVAAAMAALAVPPAAAFVGGVVLALFVITALRARREAPAGAPAPAAPVPVAPVPVAPVLPAAAVPALAPAPTEGMPTAFGRALIEKLPTPLLVVSRTGRIPYANPAARAALPRLQPDAHFASVIRAPAFVEAMGATLADGEERWVRFATHQGRERFFEARVAMLPPDGAFGAEALAIAQIEDRTETRRAEQLRSDFIANASHELRTPLASVIGYIETLQHHARNDPEARERFLGIMAREAGRMQRLVDDLMSLSRIEMTEHVRPVEAMSLHQIAAESGAALLPVAAQRGVRLEIAVPSSGGRVLGDRDQLAQVFTNLIDNAMKYGGPGATVRVAAAAPSKANPNREGVTVSDDGPGIPREHIQRLTERFYRVNVTASRNTGGTGLGLAIVKHILNRHEGRLEIASTLGKGSAFTVWLPRSGPAEAEVAAGSATAPAPAVPVAGAPAAAAEADRRSA